MSSQPIMQKNSVRKRRQVELSKHLTVFSMKVNRNPPADCIEPSFKFVLLHAKNASVKPPFGLIAALSKTSFFKTSFFIFGQRFRKISALVVLV